MGFGVIGEDRSDCCGLDSGAPSRGSPAVQAFVADHSEQHPNAFVETPTEFRQRVEGMIDQALTMVNVMVALALIGVANTLALSVFERTRELGLLRAVGMSRRQLRRMVALRGGSRRHLRRNPRCQPRTAVRLWSGHRAPGVDRLRFAITISQIAIVMLVVVAAAAGGVAAVWLPARGPGRLDILAAIAH